MSQFEDDYEDYCCEVLDEDDLDGACPECGAAPGEWCDDDCPSWYEDE